jgi:hypothetical protein
MPVRKPIENSPIWNNKHSWEDNTETEFEGIIMTCMNLI